MNTELTLYKQISRKLENNILEQFLDDTYDNDTMERLYPNMVFLTEIGQ